jgi:hypothetical protein
MAGSTPVPFMLAAARAGRSRTGSAGHGKVIPRSVRRHTQPVTDSKPVRAARSSTRGPGT